MAKDYRVKLQVFEGPLDLLLFLVRRHDVDIDEVPIVNVIDQYLEYLDLMKSLNIELAGDFLVMAATLIEMKANKLLPAEEGDEEGEGDQDGGPNPEEELKRLLKEYEQFKKAAESLGDQDQLSVDVFARKFTAPEIIEATPEQRKIDSSVEMLLEALQGMISRSPQGTFQDLDVDRLSIADRINEIIEILTTSDRIYFSSLFDNQTTPHRIIVTFLSLLELLRLQLVACSQVEKFGPILIERSAEIEDMKNVDFGQEIDEYSESKDDN